MSSVSESTEANSTKRLLIYAEGSLNLHYYIVKGGIKKHAVFPVAKGEVSYLGLARLL